MQQTCPLKPWPEFSCTSLTGSFEVQGGGGHFGVGTISQRELLRRSLKKAWEISWTISSVIQCMAWWTQKRMVYIAKIESSRPRDTLQLGERSELRGRPKEGPPQARTTANATNTAFEPGSGEKTVP